MRQRSTVLLVLSIALALGCGLAAYFVRPTLNQLGDANAVLADSPTPEPAISKMLAAPTSSRTQAQEPPSQPRRAAPGSLPRLASIGGLVVDSGRRPAPNTRLWLWSTKGPLFRAARSQETAADGRFRFDDLDPSARYSVEVVPDRPKPSYPLRLSPGEKRHDLELLITGGCTLTVRVLDEGGSPWPGRPIQVKRESEEGRQWVTDEHGEAHIAYLPAGRVVILASPTERLKVSGRKNRNAGLMAAEVLLYPAVPSEITLQPHGGPTVTVSGRVRVDGQPGSKASIRFYGDGDHFETGTVADREGQYSIRLPKPGLVRWDVQARSRNAHPNYHGTAEVHGPGPQALDLEITTGSVLVQWELKDEEHQQPVDWSLRARRLGSLAWGRPIGAHSGTSTKGQSPLLLEGLAPGRYHLDLIESIGGPARASGNVVIKPGARSSATLTDLGAETIAITTDGFIRPRHVDFADFPLAVWGQEPEFLTSGWVQHEEQQIPKSATFLACSLGEQVAVCALPPPPWSEPIVMRAMTGGHITIQCSPERALRAPVRPRILDAAGRNWANVRTEAVEGWLWNSMLVFVTRWTSSTLPPGTYTVEMDGEIHMAHVRAGSRTHVDW